jgi:hypothetical protein
MTPAEYSTFKAQTPGSGAVPEYSGDHLFFVDKRQPRKFLVLKYINTALHDRQNQLAFQAREKNELRSSYASLLATFNSVEFSEDALKGFYIEYNLKSSPQFFTRFQYYYVSPACALLAISSNSADPKMNLNSVFDGFLKGAVPAQAHNSISEPGARPEPKQSVEQRPKKSLLKIVLTALVSLSIFGGVLYLPTRFIFTGLRKPKTANQYMLTRRILARMSDGYLVSILMTMVISIMTDVLWLEASTEGLILNIGLFGIVVIGSTWLLYQYGQTPGRMFFNIKVVDAASEKKPDFLKLLIRDIPYYLVWVFSIYIVFRHPEQNKYMIDRSSGLCRDCDYTSMIWFWGLFLLFQLLDFICALVRKDKKTIRDLVSHLKVVEDWGGKKI